MSWRQSRYSMENGRGASNSQAQVFSQSSRLSEWTDRTPAEPLLNDVQDLSLPLSKIRRGGTRDESEVGSLQTVRSSGAVYEIPGLLGGSGPVEWLSRRGSDSRRGARARPWHQLTEINVLLLRRARRLVASKKSGSCGGV
jgi:hypothetical protein